MAKPPLVPWTRRIGVALGLVAVGGAIVLAGSGTLGERDQERPGTGVGSGSASPQISVAVPSAFAGVPSLEGPSTAFTQAENWSLTVLVPSDAPRRDARLVVYRADALVREVMLRRADRMRISDVPLRQGENRLSVAIETPAGIGPRSGAIAVTRDNVAPQIALTAPTPGTVVKTPDAALRGTSEPGATIQARNVTMGLSVSAGVAADGSFAATLPLALGPNEISVGGQDAAGNTAAAISVQLERGEAEPNARLSLSSASFRLRDLPASLSLRAVFLNPDGQPIDGADVVFSLSPPGLPTSTYSATTVRGEASWLNVTLARASALSGSGYATARLTLPDGSTLQAVANFTFR